MVPTWMFYNDAMDSMPAHQEGERASLRVSDAYVDRYIEARKTGLGHSDAREDAEREADRVRGVMAIERSA